MAVARMTREERRVRTRENLVDAADRLFTANGFHATTVDAIAADAGYTKGAVYSNFASKEDLFFAVYERRVDAAVGASERLLADLGTSAAIERATAEGALRKGRDDGWLAVFFEFWSHVLRHPELRDRFARVHARNQAPFAAALERDGLTPTGTDVAPDELVVAAMAMDVGLALERLVRPDAVDATLSSRMARRVLGT
jgi:AcrR family transcriptional regulator